jgi:hypothetical protein
LAQLTTQSTPAFVVSLSTVAATGAVALVSIVLGGSCVRLMLSGSVTRNEADALKLWSAVASAVRIIVDPTIPGICSGPGTTNVTGAAGAE